MFRQILVVLCLVFLGLANALSIEKRIVNGVDADPYEFPSIGSLHYLGKHQCGAVLVSRTKVLTAAHCVEGENPADLSVVFGANDIKDPNQQSRSVAFFVPHDQYAKSEYYSHNDIAMITLATPVDLNPNVQPATLAQPGSSFIGQTCKIAGWGSTWHGDPTYLQKAYITNIPNDECLRRWRNHITRNHTCVFGQDQDGGNAPGACTGDSGGPLYCGPNFEYVAGLASYVYGFCSVEYPSVYTKVSEYMDWIKNHM